MDIFSWHQPKNIDSLSLREKTEIVIGIEVSGIRVVKIWFSVESDIMCIHVEVKGLLKICIHLEGKRLPK